MKTSRLLRKAANEYLWDGTYSRPGGVSEFSCIAISLAECGGDENRYSNSSPARLWVEETFSIPAYTAFEEFGRITDAQGARYAWLMFASMYAAELEARGEL
jgi:hypothetical protein